MKKLIIILTVCFTVSVAAKAQKMVSPITTPTYGQIDKADLELKACDFEKEANAMVLFDKANIYYDPDFSIIMERHKRVKIFNENGKNEANIRIEFNSLNRVELITGLQAEVFNLSNGTIETTRIDGKQLTPVSIDKSHSAYVFTFPNVKPGSVIEYKYKWTTTYISNFPDWAFQGNIPVRYSELNTHIPDLLTFNVQSRVREPFVVDRTATKSQTVGTGATPTGGVLVHNEDTYTFEVETRLRAMANVHSLVAEPYMNSANDNIQGLYFQLTGIKPVNGFVRPYADSWDKVGAILINHPDFGLQLNKKLTNEAAIINTAKGLRTQQEKVAYIFKQVQANLKWNGQDRWYTNDGTVAAWDNKTGNSAEINLILYHLLKKAEIKAYPMIVSTREHGKVNAEAPFLNQFNRAVVYATVNGADYFILDATGKYNIYDEIPANLLNSTGFYINMDNNTYNTMLLTDKDPSMQMITVNADVKPDGKVAGSAQLNEYGYNRTNAIKKYKTAGEKNYVEQLQQDNDLKISALKFDNMDIDTLPLAQNISFKTETADGGANTIKFSPAQFVPLRTNPFLTTSRVSDIDFGYRDNFSLVGNYKLPQGYKADELPKNITMQTPDKGIVFKRLVTEQDGVIMVRYVIDYKKPVYSKEDYNQLFDFYKKVHDLINEPVVLKKS